MSPVLKQKAQGLRMFLGAPAEAAPAVAPHAPETGLIALSLNANPLSFGILYVLQTGRRVKEKEGEREKREGE